MPEQNEAKGKRQQKKMELDWKKVDELLEAGCEGTQVAAFFGIHEDTFYNRVKEKHKVGFSAYRAQKRARGDSKLLTKQFEVAMDGDRTMLVWLGKNRLTQTDKQDLNHSGEIGVTMKIINYSTNTHEDEQRDS